MYLRFLLLIWELHLLCLIADLAKAMNHLRHCMKSGIRASLVPEIF
uniref:Uncharacterized protein n=1 Tax=Anguilla anguilla TaxID=7936 RepID=A0A0E9QF74_ANGAN